MPVKVFISCVSDEFRACRDQLRTDLTRDNVEVKVQEDFKDKGVVTLDMLDIYIRACDAVVHLVGDMTGAAAKPASTQAILTRYPDITERFPPLREALARGEDISYTQWEAWLALWHGKTLLIAKAGDAAPRGPASAPTAASRAAQQAHLDRLCADEHYPGCTFDNADQLAKYVFSSPILDLLAKERGGTQSGWAGNFSIAGLLFGMSMLLIAVAAPVAADLWARTLGVAVAAPLTLVLAVAGIALPFVYGRYFIMLGAGDGPAGSRDRQGYDDLRQNLATGGPAVHLYARWLTAFLDRVDRFFGDAGMADRTLFPHAFGLKTPAPLWTAPAFDRCLLLALLYPIITVFIMWALSGHAGPAEEALGLQRDLPGWVRGIAVTAVGFNTLAPFVGTSLWSGIKWPAVSVASVVAGAVAGTGASAVGMACASALLVLVADVVAGATVVAGIVVLVAACAGVGVTATAYAIILAVCIAVAIAADTVSVAIVIGGAAFAFAFAFDFDFALVVAGFGAIAWLSDRAARNSRHGVVPLLFFVAMTAGCLGAAYLLASARFWHDGYAAMLLFLGLLTLLNAPFDWVSLGLTRALLRRGLELKDWRPFFLAVADALAAAVIIALLALTMVIGVQTFNALAVHGGGTPVLPLVLDGIHGHASQRVPLLDGLAFHPEAPEYWWVYALLLSTMIPSLINLVIGGTALIRAVPGLSPALLRFLPATGGVAVHDRAWIAAVLTLQAALGVILGVAVQALVAWGLIFHAMPAAGLGLLDLARSLAALDLPMRLIELLTGGS